MHSTFAGALVLISALSAKAVVVTPRNFMSPFGPGPMERGSLTTCGTNGETSCQNTTVQTDLCCFESPGVRQPKSRLTISSCSWFLVGPHYSDSVLVRMNDAGQRACVDIRLIKGYQSCNWSGRLVRVTYSLSIPAMY
jgi:hypothetical protein